MKLIKIFYQLGPKLKIILLNPMIILGILLKNFGINVYTILWANDLTYWRANIQPGDKLTILPVDGILHKIKKAKNFYKLLKI